MKTKTWKIIILVLTVIVLILSINVFIQEKFIRTYTCTEIEYRGYTTQDIKEIDIFHSYINRILGYNEWRISVEFKEVPDILFWFTYRNDQIVSQGIGWKDSIQQPDKDDIFEYSEKYKNGTLLKD